MEPKLLIPSDSKDLALLHYRSFKSFFLTSLGTRFLKRFYKAILGHANGFGVGVFDKGKLVGFSVGATEVAGFYKIIAASNLFGLLFAALPMIFFPKNVLRLCRSLFLNNKGMNGACLLSICVAQEYENRGIGSILIQQFEKALLQKKIGEYYLTTDASDNDKANSFYLKNKFHLIGQLSQTDRKLNIYHKKL